MRKMKSWCKKQFASVIRRLVAAIEKDAAKEEDPVLRMVMRKTADWLEKLVSTTSTKRPSA